MVTLFKNRLYRDSLKVLPSVLGDGLHVFAVVLDGGGARAKDGAQLVHTARTEGGVINIVFLGFIAHIFQDFCLRLFRSSVGR